MRAHITICTIAILALTYGTRSLADEAPWQKLKPGWWRQYDFTAVRGVNYLPSYAYNDIDQWHDYEPETVDRELSYAHLLNLNSVRIWLHQYAYELDPERFLDNFEDFLARCDKYGLTAMPVVFDGFYTGELQEPRLGLEVCVANPGLTKMQKERWPELHKYLNDVVGNHIGDPRIIAWDIMNEPSSLGVPEIAKGDGQFAWDFARAFADYVNELDDTHPVTIGVGNHSHIPWVWDHVDLVSVHIYQAFENSFQIEIDAARKLARDKPLVITETVMTTMASTPHLSARMIRRNKIGWYFCSFVVTKQPLITPHAILTTDGVAFAPDYVAAVLGFTVPAEAQLERFDRFRIVAIIEGLDQAPTNAENLDEHLLAIRELGRCIGWAGVAEPTRLNEAAAHYWRAEELLASGKEEQAYPLFDRALRELAKIANEHGFFDDMSEPSIEEIISR